MLLALLAQPDTHVEFDRDYAGMYCVAVRPQGAHGRGQTLTQAIAQAFDEVFRFAPVSARHARDRARVRLPEGGLGTLVYLNAQSQTAHVITDERRHRHLPARSLTLVES